MLSKEQKDLLKSAIRHELDLMKPRGRTVNNLANLCERWIDKAVKSLGGVSHDNKSIR